MGTARQVADIEEPYSNPEQLRLALEQLGSIFIKLGQVLSAHKWQRVQFGSPT
jgi:predicted unusual protein kinase regulating ubiquinone biosynthesis (AarF/ABC1/UbiB family)